MTDEDASRRSIPRGAAVTAAAGVAGYAVAAGIDVTTRPSETAAANGYGAEETAGNRLAAVSDIPAGGGLILGDAAVVLTRGDSGDVIAFSATCTHQGCTVNAIEESVIVCPCHLSRFALATGEPVSGPAQRPLLSIAVEVRGEDVYTA